MNDLQLGLTWGLFIGFTAGFIACSIWVYIWNSDKVIDDES